MHGPQVLLGIFNTCSRETIFRYILFIHECEGGFKSVAHILKNQTTKIIHIEDGRACRVINKLFSSRSLSTFRFNKQNSHFCEIWKTLTLVFFFFFKKLIFGFKLVTCRFWCSTILYKIRIWFGSGSLWTRHNFVSFKFEMLYMFHPRTYLMAYN